MLVCGKCPKSGINEASTKRAFRIGIERLIDKVYRYDEWGPDPELQQIRKRESGRAYRDSHRDELRERRDDRRLAKLRDQMRRNHGETKR